MLPRTCAEGQAHSSCTMAMRDPTVELVCITVYKKGAAEVARRLAA